MVILSACQNKQKDYYDTGELEAEYTLNDEGYNHGEKRIFYKNGQLHEIVNYENGVLQGKAIRYDSLGNLLVKGQFLDGEKHGKITSYYPNGKMSNFITYNRGKRHGEIKTFNKKGDIEFYSLMVEDSSVYWKDYKIDSVFRRYLVDPIELSISSKKTANIRIKAYGPLEDASKIMYSLYNLDSKEPIRRDTIPLKTDINTIDVTDLADNNSYYLEVEVFINPKERYFQVVTIKTGNSVLP